MKLALAAIAVVVLLLVGLAVVTGSRETRSSPAATQLFDGGSFRGSEPPARFTLPSFELTSYSGGAVASDELAGKVVLLTILDAQCTDVCPILASVVAGAVDRLTPEERRQVRALAVVGDGAGLVTPCGGCRQKLREFASADTPVLVGDREHLRAEFTLAQLLPSSFGPENLAP